MKSNIDNYNELLNTMLLVREQMKLTAKTEGHSDMPLNIRASFEQLWEDICNFKMNK